MKTISVLILLLGVSAFSCLGSKRDYKGVTEQKALQASLKVLSVYYPADAFCVSDSIYDLDWFFFANDVDSTTKNIVQEYRIYKNGNWEEPKYSKQLSGIAGNLNCRFKKAKYTVHFSEPYHNMIRCDVMPYDKKIGIEGRPTIESFIFKNNEQGEIILFAKATLNID